MRKQCSICRLQVTPSLDGSCPDCGVSLDDAPETVDINSTSVTSCAACGSLLLGSEEKCPACGVALPARGAPVGAAGAKRAKSLGAPRPKNAEDARLWADLPVGWSADGDTNPDAVKPPPTAPARAPIPPTPVAAAPVLSPSSLAPPPVPAPFLSAAIAPQPPPSASAKTNPATPSPTGTGGPIESMLVGQSLELVEQKKSPTKDWDRKWQRAEADAKRGRPRGSGRGRLVLYLFALLVIGSVGGAIAAQQFGLLPMATPTPVAAVSPEETEAATATPEATPAPTPAKLLPLMTTEKRLARAESLAKKGKLADAIKEYDLLLEFEPELAEVHFRQASLYAKLKNFGKACVAYRRYLEIEPEGQHAKVANAGAVRCR